MLIPHETVYWLVFLQTCNIIKLEHTKKAWECIFTYVLLYLHLWAFRRVVRKNTDL